MKSRSFAFGAAASSLGFLLPALFTGAIPAAAFALNAAIMVLLGALVDDR